MNVKTTEEANAEYSNEIRLIASDIISTLYQRREVMQLKLIHAAVERALEMIAEERTRNDQAATDRKGH